MTELPDQATGTPADRRRPIGTSVAGIVGSVVIGAIVAWAGSDGGVSVGAGKVFVLCAIAAFAINWLAYIPSVIARTEHYYDLTGSFTYLTVTAMAVVFVGRYDGRSVILVSLIAIWALRLGSFLFARVKRSGKDGRFDRIKTDWLRFLMSWTVQGLWVLLTLAAALAAITAPDETAIGPLAIVGLLVWILGFSIEVVADLQKSRFKNNPDNAGSPIRSGLWAWSRHPNYFGEITLWTGVALIALPALDGWRYVTLISPVFVYLLLTRVSGVPMLEHRADKRWGGDPSYEAYKESTPVLIPRPPRQT